MPRILHVVFFRIRIYFSKAVLVTPLCGICSLALFFRSHIVVRHTQRCLFYVHLPLNSSADLNSNA